MLQFHPSPPCGHHHRHGPQPAPRSRPWRALALLAALAAAPQAMAEGSGVPMSGDAFEAYTEGRTLTFALDGFAYGIEQYLPGRRVIWAFRGQECREGSWFEAGDQICFVYDDEPERQHCWQFFETDSGLLARFVNGIRDELVEVDQSDEPLFCPGPEVGA